MIQKNIEKPLVEINNSPNLHFSNILRFNTYKQKKWKKHLLITLDETYYGKQFIYYILKLLLVV